MSIFMDVSDDALGTLIVSMRNEMISLMEDQVSCQRTISKCKSKKGSLRARRKAKQDLEIATMHYESRIKDLKKLKAGGPTLSRSHSMGTLSPKAQPAQPSLGDIGHLSGMAVD